MQQEIDILRTLTQVPGPAGYEAAIQSHFQELVRPYATLQYSDAVGNCYTEIAGHPDAPRLMFTAHCDTIGFMIKYIDDMGFIFTEDIGGDSAADPKMLPGTRVSILARNKPVVVSGQFIPVIPYHLVQDEADEAQTIRRHNMAIDIGVTSQAEALKVLNIGDYVIFRHMFEPLGSRISGTYMDDRVGLYLLYLLGKYAHASRAKRKPTVILASTVCEEGLLGTSGMVVTTAKPSLSITLDIAPATDMIVHDADFEIAKKHGMCKLGAGPVIARGMAITEAIFMHTEQTCLKHDIPYQIELSKTDTDNKFIHICGARTGLIMVPVRNAHTCVETIAEKDLSLTLRLCQHLIRTLR